MVEPPPTRVRLALEPYLCICLWGKEKAPRPHIVQCLLPLFRRWGLSSFTQRRAFWLSHRPPESDQAMGLLMYANGLVGRFSQFGRLCMLVGWFTVHQRPNPDWVMYAGCLDRRSVRVIGQPITPAIGFRSLVGGGLDSGGR